MADEAATPAAQPETTPIYDISGQQPVLGDMPHGDVQEALLSGKYAMPQGDVPVFDPDGNLGTLHSSEIHEGVKNGYTYATPEAARNWQFDTPGEQVKAGVEGLGQGLLGPAFTAAERVAGVPAENIKTRAEVHPWTHGIAETAGLVGPALATMGASAEARAGIAAASKFTQMGAIDAVSEAALSRLGVATGEALKNAPTLTKIGSTAAKFAADNAIFDIGDQLNSTILRNPPQDLGHAAAEVGLAGLIGAPFGAAIGSVAPLWEATKGTGLGRLVGAVMGAGGADSALSKTVADDLATTGLADKAPATVKARLSDIPEAQEAGNRLMQQTANGSGRTVQGEDGAFRTMSRDSLAEAAGVAPSDIAAQTKMSEASAGSNHGQKLGRAYDEIVQPAAKPFEEDRARFKDKELIDPAAQLSKLTNDAMEAQKSLSPERAVEAAERLEAFSETAAYKGADGYGVVATPSGMSDALMQLADKEGWLKNPSSEGMKEVSRLVKEMPLKKTVGDITDMIQANNERGFSNTVNKELPKAMGKINSVLREAEASAVMAHLGETEGKAAVEGFKAKRAAYTEVAKLRDDLNTTLRIPNANKAGVSGYGKLVRQYADRNGEKFWRKVSGSNDAYFLKLVQEKFPEVAEDLRKSHAARLLWDSSDKDGINPKSLLTNINEKMSPEMKSFVVSDKLQATAEAVDRLYAKLKDPHFNYSGSGIAKNLLEKGAVGSAMGMMGAILGHGALGKVGGYILGHLGEALGRDVPDAGRLAFLKLLGSKEGVSAPGFKAMVDTIDASLKGETKIAKASKAIFKGSLAVGGEKVADLVTQKDRDRLDKRVQQFKEDPQKAMQVGGSVAHYLPEHGAALGHLAATSMQYLDSLKPKMTGSDMQTGKVTASKVQQARYDNALNIAQKPTVVLHKIAKGNLSSNDVKDLQALYPSLYDSFKQKLTTDMMDHLSKGKSVPYQTRLALSMFLGHPVDSTVSQQSIAAAQPMPEPQQPQQNGNGGISTKHTTLGLQKLAKNNFTPLQSRESDRTGDVG